MSRLCARCGKPIPAQKRKAVSRKHLEVPDVSAVTCYFCGTGPLSWKVAKFEGDYGLHLVSTDGRVHDCDGVRFMKPKMQRGPSVRVPRDPGKPVLGSPFRISRPVLCAACRALMNAEAAVDEVSDQVVC